MKKHVTFSQNTVLKIFYILTYFFLTTKQDLETVSNVRIHGYELAKLGFKPKQCDSKSFTL
jgi:hypothetical protein